MASPSDNNIMLTLTVSETTPAPVPAAVKVQTATDRALALHELAQEIQAEQKVLAGKTKDVHAMIKALKKDIAQMKKAGVPSSAIEGGNGAASSSAVAASSSAVAAPRAPSVPKPVVLSVELCEFLGVPVATTMVRTDAAHLVSKYVKDNTLFDVKDKRTITPNDKLMKLLAVKADETLTYLNLQAHMKHHFLKTEPVAAPAAPAAVEV